MTNNKAFWLWGPVTVIALLVAWFVLFMATPAPAQEAPPCPPPAKSCKIIAITPDEEASLIQPNGIFDMAEWASRPLYQFTSIWREKLRLAPLRENVLLPPPRPKDPQ